MTTTSNGHVPDRPVPEAAPPWGTPPDAGPKAVESAAPEAVDPDPEVLTAGYEFEPKDKGKLKGERERKPEPVEQHVIPLPAPPLIPRRPPARGEQEPDPEGGPVDRHLVQGPPEPLVPKRHVPEGERPPAAPLEFTDLRVMRDSAVRVVREVQYRAIYSITRPHLLARVAWWSLRGASVTIRRLTRWGFDVDGHPLIGEITAHGDREYMRMAHERTRRQKFRLGLLGAAFAMALVLGILMPAQLLALVIVSTLALFARAGRPQGETLLSPSVTRGSNALPRLTHQLIIKGLAALGIAPLTKQMQEDPTHIWRSDISTIRGGHVVRIQLPFGVVADQIIPHEQRLAAAFGRPEDTVIVEPLPHITPGDLKLYVLDKPVLSGVPATWPLAGKRKVSLFEPIPLGVDRLGRPYKLPLIEQNIFTGGIPGSGKSALIRVIAAAAALDSLCTLSIINCKGTPDFMALQPVCHRYLSANPDVDREFLPAALAVLEEVAADVGKRADLLTRAARRDEAPDSKITAELAGRISGLRPYVLVIDEAHRLFEPPADEDQRQRAEGLLTQIIRLGRAHGVILVLATQLGDADSMPPKLLRMASVRMCMRVSDHVALNQIMGNGASKVLGVPTDFTPGTGLVRTATGTRKIRSYYLDGTDLARIGQTALAHRKMLDALSGQAVGEDIPTAPPVDRTALLSHVLECIGQAAPVGEQVAWTGGSDGLAAVLSARFPDVYGGLSDRALNKELKDRGVELEYIGRWVSGEQRTFLGVRREAIVERLSNPDRRA